MQHTKFLRSPLTFLLLTVCTSCNNGQLNSGEAKDTINTSTTKVIYKLPKPLQVGDKIELSGGYDYDPLFLKNPPGPKRTGTIISFITGQNETPAAVVKLDNKISGQKVTGDIAVLELRQVEQTFQEPTPVHIELCDFMPEDKAWKDRRQGEWVEAAATVTLVQTQK